MIHLHVYMKLIFYHKLISSLYYVVYFTFAPNSINNYLRLAYWDIGDPIWECEHCGAMMWFEERTNKRGKTNKPKFSLCCMQGKVQLPLLRRPPQLLINLLEGNHPRSKHFIENIRPYNMMHSFTSMGGKIQAPPEQGRGPYNFKIGGQNHHLIGSLLPTQGGRSKFSQLYIYDTEHEIDNRKTAVRYNIIYSFFVVIHIYLPCISFWTIMYVIVFFIVDALVILIILKTN